MSTRKAIIGIIVSLALLLWSRVPSQPFATYIITTALGILGLIISIDYLYGAMKGRKLSENKWFQTIIFLVGIILVGRFIYLLFTADTYSGWGVGIYVSIFIIIGLISLVLIGIKIRRIWND